MITDFKPAKGDIKSTNCECTYNHFFNLLLIYCTNVSLNIANLNDRILVFSQCLAFSFIQFSAQLVLQKPMKSGTVVMLIYFLQ